MIRQRSRAARRCGLLVSALAGTWALLWVLASDLEPASAHEVGSVTGPRTVDVGRPVSEAPVLPLPPPPRAADVEMLATAPPEPVIAAPALAERVERAVGELAGSLRDGPVDRSTWETGVRAVAGSLGPDAMPLLLERAADSSLPDEDLIAVAELLRVGSSTTAAPTAVLPEPALGALRRSLDQRPRPPSATAAARALGALGTRDDTSRLLGELLDPQTRSLASWGLQAAPSVALLDDLRGVLATDIDTESRAAVLTTMEGWARTADSAQLEGPGRDATATAVAALLVEASVEPALRRRAAGALAALGGAPARSALEALCNDPASDDGLLRIAVAALATDADPLAAVVLEDGLWSASSPAPRRLAFAEGLAGMGSWPARQALFELAGASSSPADQRRALYALGALSPGTDTVTAASIALEAPDPSVRAAGIWALARTPAASAQAPAIAVPAGSR